MNTFLNHYDRRPHNQTLLGGKLNIMENIPLPLVEEPKSDEKEIMDRIDKLFEEIDNRGKDIFVVLTYPSEITKETTITISGNILSLSELVIFVAIKNGEHQSKGFAYFSEGISEFAPPQGRHVSQIHNTVLQFFGIGS